MAEQPFAPMPFGPGLVLHRRLGAGGMAEVFRGVQTGVGGFQKIVAIKRMLPNLADSEDFEKMFQAEVNLTGRLQHPNIVQVFGNGEHDGYLYVVMEYVNGRDLAKILSVLGQRGESLPIPLALLIGAEVARGLDYAHGFRDPATDQRECLVHRDISPQNIMVSFDGQVKVVDFGIAKITDGVESTRTGTIRGKLAYMAPEQAAGEPFDHRIDVFALGVVLHECLTGARLFRGSNQADTLRRVLMCNVPPPSAKNAAISPELDRIVLKALARDPADRYGSAYELQRDLTHQLSALAPGMVPRELGRFLTTLFADSIAQERDNDRMISSEHAPTTSTPSGSMPRVATGTAAPRVPPPPATSGSASVRMLTGPLPVAPPRSSALPFAIGAAVIAAGIAAVALREGTADPKLPDAVPGLVGWYRADTVPPVEGSRVAEWRSSVSKVEADAVQPDPARQPLLVPNTLAGSPVVQFDGASQFLIADTLAYYVSRGEGLTVMFVARPTDDRAQFVLAVQQEDPNIDVARIGFAEGARVRVKVTHRPATEYLDSEPQPAYGFATYAMVIGADEVEVFFDGKRVLERPIEPVQLGRARRLSLGQEWDDGGKPSDLFAGQLAEVAVYDRALEPGERRSVEAYLAKKYGLAP